MVQVAGLGAHSLFLSFVLPSVFCSFSPIRASIAWAGVDGVSSASIRFFFLSLLGIVARRPRGSGIRYLSNKI